MAQGKKKTSRKNNKKITLKEFRAWLQGVEELQPDDWSPSADQWKKIRDKIDNIVEEEQPTQVVYQQTHNGGSPGAGAETQPPAPAAPSAPVTPTGPPMGGSTLEEAEAFAPARQPAPSIDSAPPIAAPGTEGQGPRIKTPDIDTSDGSYGSSFE